MDNKEYMIIDGIPVEINGEKNLLELIRKVGIKLPTFCYHSELSIYGACRMCMVENKRGELEAACSTPPRAGMEIRTNVERLRRYRKMILELLLANHCRDCTTCGNNGKCKLQDLAMKFNMSDVRFPNGVTEPEIDNSSPCITRDQNRCILCGDCVRVCNEIQGVGAIDFAHRGAKMKVSTAFDRPIANSPCVGCGQCAAVCPTGAIVVKNDADEVWKALDDRNTSVSVQVAPAVRVAIGKEFGLPDGENAIGRIAAALRRMNFDRIYDTSTGADLTVLEESEELLERLSKENSTMPMFTSCCPAWVNYCEKSHPELLPHISTCRSPMQMLASVIKEQKDLQNKRRVHVAVMPCTAKKFEASRSEFAKDGTPNVDYVITTQELIQMIKESGIVFSELEPEAMDLPLGINTGAGVIFGVTGGVTEAVLRRLYAEKSMAGLFAITYKDVRGLEGVKKATIQVGEKELKIAIVSGLKNASELVKQMKSGEAHFDFIEVMACPGGCINGAGQPYGSSAEVTARGKGLYSADKLSAIKRSEENPLMNELYGGILKGRVHELLHVEY